MPTKPRHPCAWGRGCQELTAGRYCPEHERQAQREYDAKREREEPWRAWIHSTRWRDAIEGFKAKHPLCAECERHGRVTPVYLVDHIRPHEGNYDLFWDEANWQSMCNPCHEEKHKGERWRK